MAMATNLITQARLKNLLRYDADTGVFTWVYTRPKCPKNAVAGWRCKDGYTMICLDYRIYRAHRLAWLYVHGVFPDEHMDHINNTRTDNRIVNLRPATPAQNQQNLKLRRDSTSKHAGVSWSKAHDKWYTYINVSTKRKFLGLFANINDAIMARKQAELTYHPFKGR
jgi:hypothetical protein